MKSCHFSRIVIIQSLPAGEFRSGARLREDLSVLNDAKDLGLKIELFDLRAKSALLELIKKLTGEVNSSGEYPIIHIEAHGDKKGIILSLGDFVSWNDLKKSFMDLNIATRNNLFIVLAACYGAHIIETLKLTDRTPCWCLVGPTEMVTPDSVLRTFSAFYEEVFTSGNGDKAVQLLNKDIKEGDIKYYFTTAEVFFEKVFKKYINKSCTPKSLKERARGIRKQLEKSGHSNLPSINQISRNLGNTRESFEKYKKIFFMIDFFPENMDRFTVEYTDLIRKTR